MSPLSCPLPFPQPYQVYRILLLQNSGEVRSSQLKKEPCLSGHKAKTSEVDAFPHVSVYIGNLVLGHVQKIPL